MDTNAETPEPALAPHGVLPEGVRFVGTLRLAPAWGPGDAPSDEDLDRCVGCGLCLPHCPTYRLTGEETASPRGRIAAMRAVAEGHASVNATLAGFLDACLACRACEDVCPSHVPYGRLIERARVQLEPLRTGRERRWRRLGLRTVLTRPWLTSLVAGLQPLGRPFLSARTRSLLPRRSRERPLPPVTQPRGEPRGTVALLTGCVQDRWYRSVNLAAARVLARNGWRVVVPKGQGCCGALHAHHGQLETARTLGRRTLSAFGDTDVVLSTAAGCSAHLGELGDLLETDDATEFAGRTRDVLAFLAEQHLEPPGANPGVERVAYHDACHALRALHLRDQPRALLATIPGLEVVDVPDGETCCGAAGLSVVTQPETADALMRAKAEGIASTGASVVVSANPGCTMQIAAGLRALGAPVEVLHPIELLDRAYAAERGG
ncbi:MAG TPA: (Fe-S)-binding protein [Actinomycetota bacterium]|nr:(Fe-S)-binding protein [Actinomycetota bacterium]